jgi:hypothetical protein
VGEGCETREKEEGVGEEEEEEGGVTAWKWK